MTLRIVHFCFLYSSDSNRQPVALISNITLISPSTSSKNDTITSIYTNRFYQKHTITLIQTGMQVWSTSGCKFHVKLQVLLRLGTPVF